jgi:hypothetical protein
MSEKELAIDDLLLDQGFRNWALEIEDDETLFWVMLKNEYPQFKKSMNRAKFIVLTAETELPLIDQTVNHEMFDKLRGKLEWNKSPKVIKLNSHKSLYFKIAASVLFLLAFGLVTMEFIERNNRVDESVSVTQQPKIDFVEKTTPSGAKLNFYLADGTHIILNAESSIKFKKSFSTDKKRDVYLEGEAYFEVAKDASRPFTVYTDHLSTTALGTEFNIQANKDNDVIKISLVEGSIMVVDSENNSDLLLEPGEKVSVNKENNNSFKERFDVKEITSWKEGVIYFDKTDFNESLKTLERWYGVNIDVQDRPDFLLTCSGEFENDNLSNVLNSLGFALNFDFDIDAKHVQIKFK